MNVDALAEREVASIAARIALDPIDGAAKTLRDGNDVVDEGLELVFVGRLAVPIELESGRKAARGVLVAR